MKKTIFVLGAGNGCGNRVAEKVLMARNAEHLAAYEAEFKEDLPEGQLCCFPILQGQ